MPDSDYEKKKLLFLKQKELLETYLKTGAITKAQFEFSLGNLTEKMGMNEFNDI